MPFYIVAILRIAHVIAGAIWFGIMVFNSFFLLPSIRDAGPAGGAVMKQIVQVRKLPNFLYVAVFTNLITGAILFWWVSDGLNGDWLSSATGMALSLGAVLAIIAALLGFFVNAPAALRLGRLAAEAQAAGGPPSDAVKAEMQGLQKRMYRATQMAAVLLALVVAAMAAARNL